MEKIEFDEAVELGMMPYTPTTEIGIFRLRIKKTGHYFINITAYQKGTDKRAHDCLTLTPTELIHFICLLQNALQGVSSQESRTKPGSPWPT